MSTCFADLGLLPSLLETLERERLGVPTEIQARIVPELLARRSVVGLAETGSGKTLAYVLPVLDRLKRLEDAGNRADASGEPRAVVLVPTRELGEQVARVFKTFTHHTRLRVRTVLGGQKLRHARENVDGVFEVLVATPGRLERLVADQRVMLGAVRFVVLDEADQLLDLGFLPQVLEVVRACPSQRQLALFSATLSVEVKALIGRLFTDAVVIETHDGGVAAGVRTENVPVADGRRLPVLLRVLEWPEAGGTILFVNTREQCDRLAATLREAGWSCAVLRGSMDSARRRQSLAAFRAREIPLLLCTDMTARGLDIPHVGRVVNVHLPRESDAYVHRAGRTARAGRAGLVVNLVTPRDAPLLERLGYADAVPEVQHPKRR